MYIITNYFLTKVMNRTIINAENSTDENSRKKLKMINWGLIEYNKAWHKQEELFNNIIDKKQNNRKTENYIVFCEHPNVYTLGKSGDEHNLLINSIELQAKDTQFVHTNRGGDITYHGPGQIVCYPILDLENFDIGLRKYIYNIEEAVINTIKKYGINGERLEKATGVWLDVGKPNVRKICAIGVKSSKFVTMHGLALNVNTNLDYFNYINPCGFLDKGVTSIQKEIGKMVKIEEVEQELSLQLSEIFI